MEYYDTGELMLEETYQDGVIHGRFATYHPNGNLLSEGMYVNGLREGYFRINDENGDHVKSFLFISNQLAEEVNVTAEQLDAE